MFLFDAGSFSSHGRFAVNDLAEKERRCRGGLGLKEKGIKAGAAANHQRLISLSDLCKSVQVSSLERFHAICAILRVTRAMTALFIAVELLLPLTSQDQMINFMCKIVPEAQV